MTEVAGSPRRRFEFVQLASVVTAAVAWLGWFQVAPALGFPTMGPAAMLNRIFVPDSDPGVWVGWVVLGIAVVAVGALYAVATGRRWFRPGPVSGLLYGLVVWAVVGLIVMVIIGHVAPPGPALPAPPGAPPAQPDPMHATFMMLHLGALAPIEGLAAWLLFGSVLGAAIPFTERGTAAASAGRTGPGVAPASGLLVVAAALTLCSWSLLPRALQARAQGPSSGVQTQLLATGQARALPQGAVFASILRLPQAAGAKLGPHAHVPGFAYVLDGQATISYGSSAIDLDVGDGAFMAALAIHSHENRKDRMAVGFLAAGLLVFGLLLSVVALTKLAGKTAVTVLLTGGLLAAGAAALWNPWANDWFFISVRPASARAALMPLPHAARVYESPDLMGLSPGPYTESLRLITIPVDETFSVQREPGAEIILVLNGQAAVRSKGSSPISLARFQSALVQQGSSIQVTNEGAEPLRLLSFSVVGSDGSA